MTKNATKRAFMLSLLSLLMCCTMLIGTTFAWFTDTVTSTGNRIVAGTLEIELQMDKAKNGTYVDVSGDSGDIFSATNGGNGINWEPGKTEIVYLAVANKGSLAVKYDIMLDVEDEGLVDALDYAVLDGKKAADVTSTDWNSLKNVASDTGKMAAGRMEVAPDGTLLENATNYFAFAVHMREDAGNAFQNKAIEIDVTVMATQLNSETDSFGDEYDANAVFGGYAEVATDAELVAALANAEADAPLTIVLKENVNWVTTGNSGVNDVTAASKVTIDGQGTYTLTATGSGVTGIGDNAAPFTFKNLTVVDRSVSYNEGAWEFGYLEFGGTELICENVNFLDPIIVESDKASFNNCSFLGKTTETKMYGVWVLNGDAVFTKCTFTGTRGMKVCDMYASEVGTVVIDGCTFIDLSEKPGIALDDCDAQDMSIVIKNSTFINCQKGDQNLYIYETDNVIPTLENNVIESYKELVEIATKDELIAFAQRVNGGDGMSGVMVKLTADIDLAGMEWIPVGQTGTSYGATNYFMGIFDGQGHTISNMTITQTNAGKNYAAGFFGFVDGAALTVRNVNFDKAVVNGHHWVGVVAGYLTGTIDNCNVTNSVVKATHANNDACGDKAGAIVGYVNGGLVNNCTVSDTTVTASRDGGQVVGASKTTYVANCSATNVAVSATGDCTGANIRNEVIGRVL